MTSTYFEKESKKIPGHFEIDFLGTSKLIPGDCKASDNHFPHGVSNYGDRRELDIYIYIYIYIYTSPNYITDQPNSAYQALRLGDVFCGSRAV